MPWDNPFKYATYIHLASQINWLDVGGQVTVVSQNMPSQDCLKDINFDLKGG